MGALSADEYRAVFEASPDGIVIVDESGEIRDLNARAEEMFAYEHGELLGRKVEVLVPERLREEHGKQRAAYTARPRKRPLEIGMELTGRRKDASEFPVEISLSPLRTERGLFVISTIRDVTERRRLREFGAGSLRAAEEERARIARELHDDTVQRLAALLVQLRVARRSEDPEKRDRLLQDLRNGIHAAAESVRQIARGLRPPALEEAGVVPAIRSHVRSLQEASCLNVDLQVQAVERLPSLDAELALYRIVQEALSNVVRHAQATRVRISIAQEGGRVVATVEDDGRGFSIADLGRAGGFRLGLLGMHERARSVGGSLAIESAPGRGTRVRVEIPGTTKES